VPQHRPPVAGAFVGHHLVTGGDGRVVPFYLKLFGWSTREIRVAGSVGDTTFRSGDVDVATAGGDADSSVAWVPCLSSADPQSLVASATRLGGRPGAAAAAPPSTVMVDPTGARFAIVGPGPVVQHSPDATAPGRICWTELATDEPDRAAEFYAALAGWTLSERHRGPEGRNWVFRLGGRDVAGMVQPPEPHGKSCWVPYVQVISAEDTAALAADLGGAIHTPPGDIPGRGRYAVLSDPGGALVGVFALTDAA
jgi:uncharacterized protein